MLKRGTIFAILGAVAILIVVLATYFFLNISRIGLLESGILIGAAILGLFLILGVFGFIIKGVLSPKK